MTNREQIETFQLAYVVGFAIVFSIGLILLLRWQRKKLLQNFPAFAAVLIALGVISDND